MIRLAKQFLRGERASIVIEMAFILPLLLLLFLGTIELSRYIITLQKVDKTAYTIADLATRFTADEVTEADMQEILSFYDDLMEPFPVQEKGVAAIASVQQLGGSPFVHWQVAGGGSLGGQISEVSGAGISSNTRIEDQAARFTGSVATAFADAGAMEDGENLVIVEVWYSHETLLGQTFFEFANTVFKRNAYFVTRTSDVYSDLP